MRRYNVGANGIFLVETPKERANVKTQPQHEEWEGEWGERMAVGETGRGKPRPMHLESEWKEES